MLKFNSNQKNKICADVLLSQDTFRERYSFNRTNENALGTTKKTLKLEDKLNKKTKFISKPGKNYNFVKKPEHGRKAVTRDSVLSHNYTVTSNGQSRYKDSFTKKKLTSHKRNPLELINTGSHCNFLEAKSNCTQGQTENIYQEGLNIPQKLQLNISDLKLKDSLNFKDEKECALKSIKIRSESVINSKTVTNENCDCTKDLAFLEKKLNTIHNVNYKHIICGADREAFEIFSFPTKLNGDKQSGSNIGLMKNPFFLQDQGSNLEFSSPKRNMTSKFIDITSVTDEASQSNVDKSLELDDEISSLYSCLNKNERNKLKVCCLEQSQFVPPVLENLLSVDVLVPTPASPILDSMPNKRMQLKEGELVKYKRYPHSPVLNKVKSSYTAETKNIKVKNSVPISLMDGKTSRLGINSDNYDNFLPRKIIASPVLDSSQCKKDSFQQKSNIVFDSYMKSKLDREEFSSSPILDASQFKNPFSKLKNATKTGISLVKENNTHLAPKDKSGSSQVCCKNNSVVIQENLHSSDRSLKPTGKCSSEKIGSLFEADNAVGSSTSLNNKSCLGTLNWNSSEEGCEPLSQILDCNLLKNKLSEKTKLENYQNINFADIISENITHLLPATFKFQGKVSDEKFIDEETRCRQHGKSPLNISCYGQEDLIFSPLLESSQYKRSTVHETGIPFSKESQPRIEISNTNYDMNYTEDSRTQHNERPVSMNLLTSEQFQGRPLSLGISESQPLDSLYSVNIETSRIKSGECFTDSKVFDKVKPLSYSLLSKSLTRQLKRTPSSPARDFTSKFKKLKPDICGQKVEGLGPMFGSVLKSPLSDIGLHLNESHFNQDESLSYSPSLNSELDLRKFPILLADLPVRCSPKESSKNVQTYNDSDIVMSSQKFSKNAYKFCENKVDLTDKCKFSKESCNMVIEENPEYRVSGKMESPILSFRDAFKHPCLREKINDENGNGSVLVLKKGESCSQFNQAVSSYKGKQKKYTPKKRKVKKNLSIYYVNSNKKIDDTFESITHHEDKGTMQGVRMIGDSQMSGVGKLSTLNCDHQKPSTIEEKMNNQEHTLLRLENDSSNLKVTYSNSEVKYSNVSAVNKQQTWENRIKHNFESNKEFSIEDFDEESPMRKTGVETAVDVNKVDIVKRNLEPSFKQYPSSPKTVVAKPAVPEVESLLLNFEVEDRGKNTLVSSECGSSEESSCEVEIQEDFSQKTSVKSQSFRIEYSSTPTRKSSEGTQNEAASNPVSFPPALDVRDNTSPSAEVLDSACKNRRTRVKKGSAVERLRRLVRAQRAEVNMFHHEVEVPTRARARACSLLVDSAVQSCSLLVLWCRYADAQRTFSQELGSGEETVDPDVHMYVDPSFAKKITAGCVVTVFPPWRSVWYENRGVVVMYNVAKLRLGELNQPSIGFGTSSLQVGPPSIAADTTSVGFTCQLQDECCACRSELVGQLFTAPPQPQAGVLQFNSRMGGAITAALAEGFYPHRVKLQLTILHIFHTRVRRDLVLARLFCVDGSGLVCQLNLRCQQDLIKMGSLKEALHRTFIMKKLTVCRRIFIDRCKGLRSFLTYLHAASIDQQMLYVATPSSDEWSVQPVDKPADCNKSAYSSSTITWQQQQLLTLPISEDSEGRAKARVTVMAFRRDELFVWEPQHDLYLKLHVSASAAIPDFPARARLDLLYLWAHNGELTIDKFTEVSIADVDSGESPAIPSLAVDSSEGNLVLLDSVVTRVSSDAYLRWEGVCGHKMVHVRRTGLYWCPTCRQTSETSVQKVVLEVCVAANDVAYPIRVKVKSETARVLLADTSGRISSKKSYNVIGVIGSTLKCLAVVSEVLRNSLGDIIEFVLEEL